MLKKVVVGMNMECMFVGNVFGDEVSVVVIFGGKLMVRVVGIVKSFDWFNIGMRVEGNVKRVEYFCGFVYLYYVMREYGCRYGFILIEIEFVVVRNGGERMLYFGFLEVMSV